MTHLMIPVDAPPVAVVRAGRQFLLVAARLIASGDRLFEIHGEDCDEPNQWSVQVGPTTHVIVPPEVDLALQLDQYPWRFMNHHCEPNTRIEGRCVIAVRAIAPGDELTFNYNTTEWEMAVSFECGCGSTECGGTIRGHRHLSAAERERLRPMTSPYLRGD